MKRIIFIWMVFILSACNAAPAMPSLTPEESALTVAAQPYATQLPEPTPFPSSTSSVIAIPTAIMAEPTITPIPKLSAGQKIEITSMYMFSANDGWALESTNHVLHTNDGGSTWEDVTPQQGIYDKGGFFALDANTAWAAQDATGYLILHTTDGGQTWEATQNPAGDVLPMDIRLNLQFIDAQTGWYFGERAGHGIAHPNLASTVDGGKTWILNRSFGAYSYYTDILVVNKNILYLSGGIWGDVRDNGNALVTDYINGKITPSLEKTIDGGKTWQVISLPRLDPFPEELKALAVPNNLMACRVDSVKFAHAYSQRIVASVSCQVGTVNGTQWFYGAFHYFTEDGEKWLAWQPAPEDSAVDDFINSQTGWREIKAGGDQSCHFQKTINAGQTWNTVKTTGWCASQIDFVDEQVGWAIARSGDVTSLVHTVDGGKTWTEIKPTVAASPQVLSNTVISELQMSDETSGWAYGYSANDSSYSTFYLHTTDGGKTWVDKTPKGVSFFCSNVSLDAQTAWLINCNDQPQSWALLRTLDGGDSWTTVNENAPYFRGASVLEFASKNEGWIETYDVGAGNVFIKLSATHDGGRTWKPVVIEGPYAEIGNTTHLCNICDDSFYYDPLRVLLGFGDMGSMTPSGKVSLSMSTDLGKSWKDLVLPLPSADFNDYLVTPRLPIFFNQNDGVMPVRLVKEADIGVTHSLAFYMTLDGGKSWKADPAVLEKLNQCDLRVEAVSLTDIFVGCGNALYITHDGAQSWQTLLVNPEPGVQSYLTQLDFVSANTGWAILTTDNDATVLLMTIDGGYTWAVLKPAFLP